MVGDMGIGLFLNWAVRLLLDSLGKVATETNSNEVQGRPHGEDSLIPGAADLAAFTPQRRGGWRERQDGQRRVLGVATWQWCH